MGDHVVDRGQPASQTAEIGHARGGHPARRVSLSSAADLETALTLAKGCPALAAGGVQVGQLVDLGPVA